MSWVSDALASMPNFGAGAPDYAPPVDSGDLSVMALQQPGPANPFEEADRKKKLEAEKQAALGVFANGAPAVPSAGISGQMAQGPSGQGAPFSLAGVPQSLQTAQAITAPPPAAVGPGGVPQMQPQAPVTGLNAPIGGMQAPQASPPAADDGEEIPENAQPTQGRAPMSIAGPAPVAPPAEEPSFFQKLASGAKSISPALLGVGAALQGDQGHLTNTMLAQEKALADQTQTQNLTARALLAKGVDPTTVAAAVRQPDLLKALVADQFGKSKYKVQKVGQDEFGNEQYASVNENDPTDIKPIVNGRAVDAGSAAAASGGAASPTSAGGGGYLNKGVAAIDHSLTGEDYLNQYSPEVQAAVKNYMSGTTMPTANPRKGWVQNIKSIAQTYGASMGQPVDDATFAARRTMRNDLAKSSPGSIGGQISIGNTALGHLADLSQKAVDLGNVDVGLAYPSHLINEARGMTSAQSAKMEALKGAAQHYGQEVTKFYSGSPGGEAERNRFLETVNGAKTPQELAAVLETEAALMRDRIGSLESNIRTTLGDDATKKYPVIRDVGQKAIGQIEQNVSKLRGGTPVPPNAGPLKPGKYVWTPDKGLVMQ